MSALNKLVIFAIVVVLLTLGFYGMNWLSSMKELPEEKPPKKIVNYVKVEPVSYDDIDTEIDEMAWNTVVEYSRVWNL